VASNGAFQHRIPLSNNRKAASALVIAGKTPHGRLPGMLGLNIALLAFIPIFLFAGVKDTEAFATDSLLSPSDPYYETVEACRKLGIIQADQGDDFRLEQSLNRYQVAHATVTTLEALGIDVPKDVSKVHYADIPPGHWAMDDVAGCVNLGLMVGFEDYSFQGRSNMLKEHWLAMAFVFATKFAPPPSPDQAQIPPLFRDLPTINWLWTPINTLAKYGWLDPDVMDDDFLNRNNTVTRKILYWYLGKLILARKGPLDTWTTVIGASGTGDSAIPEEG
jgi:hypothetical protein